MAKRMYVELYKDDENEPLYRILIGSLKSAPDYLHYRGRIWEWESTIGGAYSYHWLCDDDAIVELTHRRGGLGKLGNV